MSDGVVTKIFVPGRLVLGLLAAVGGLGLIALAFTIGFSLRLAGIGAVVAVAGVAIAATSKVEGCAACKAPFVSTHTNFKLAEGAQMVSVVRSNDPRALATLVQATHTTPSDRVTATFELEYCPRCNALGKAVTGERQFLPDGSSTTQNLSPPLLLRGPVVAAAVEAIGARNTALAATFYTGTPSA
jgi:hypothetical protein